MPRQAQAQPEGGEADDLENGFEGDPGSFFWYFQEKADFFNASFIYIYFFFWNIIGTDGVTFVGGTVWGAIQG